MSEVSEPAINKPKLVVKKPKDELKPTSKGIMREVGLNLFVALLFCVFIFLLIFQFFPAVDQLTSSRAQINRIVEEYYIGDIPPKQEFVDGQLKGYVSALGDPFSDYMTQEDNDNFNDDLNERYEGIGVRFEQTNQGIVVIESFTGGPAAEAGIQRGDELLAVDGESIITYDLDTVADLIIGEAGTEVMITVGRNGKELDFTMNRQKIFTPLVRLEVDGNVGVISITSFGDGVDQEMLSVADQIAQNESVDRLILDLRSNSGGVLGSAVDIASYFLEEGQVVAIEETKQETIEDKSETKDVSLIDYPIVILTNQGTASASEIVAGALRDHRQVPIIGQTTFGKGVVQQIFELNDGNFLRLTVAKWFTPNRNKINEVGLEPDFKVPAAEDELEIVLQNYNWTEKELNWSPENDDT